MNSLARAFKHILIVIAAVLAIASPERIVAAESLAEAARALAATIVSKMGPLENAVFTFRTLASIETTDAAAAREAIEAELRIQGVRFVTDPKAAWTLRVTLSDNFLQYVWVAELQHDQDRFLLMSTQSKRPDVPPKDAALRMAIQSKQIYEQGDPILDLKLFDGQMLVLDPGHLTLYRRSNDQWALAYSASFKGPLPFPRDPRGRLSGDGDTVQVRIPGLACSGKIGPEFGLECSQQDTAWQSAVGTVELATTKNFFVRENLPPFFSAASAKDGGNELWIIAGVDGHTYLYSKDLKLVGTMERLGSDIATVESGCGAGQQVLATLPTDPLEASAIQAFEIVHREFLAVSSAVEFPGPVTALWAIPNQNAAIAVSRNTRTGRYAAFHLSISCSR